MAKWSLRHLTGNSDLIKVVGSIHTHASNFFTPDGKKNHQGTLSQGNSNSDSDMGDYREKFIASVYTTLDYCLHKRAKWGSG